jgi:hypothetical protein
MASVYVFNRAYDNAASYVDELDNIQHASTSSRTWAYLTT